MRLPFVSVKRENGAPPPPSVGTGEGKATGLQTDGNAIQEVMCHLPLLCAGHTRAKQVTASGLANAAGKQGRWESCPQSSGSGQQMLSKVRSLGGN